MLSFRQAICLEKVFTSQVRTVQCLLRIHLMQLCVKQAIRVILNKMFELLSYSLTCVGSGCVLKDFDIISYSRS